MVASRLLISGRSRCKSLLPSFSLLTFALRRAHRILVHLLHPSCASSAIQVLLTYCPIIYPPRTKFYPLWALSEGCLGWNQQRSSINRGWFFIFIPCLLIPHNPTGDVLIPSMRQCLLIKPPASSDSDMFVYIEILGKPAFLLSVRIVLHHYSAFNFQSLQLPCMADNAHGYLKQSLIILRSFSSNSTGHVLEKSKKSCVWLMDGAWEKFKSDIFSGHNAR